MRSSRFLGFVNRPIVLLSIYIFLSAMLMNFSDDASLRGVRWMVLRVVGIIDAVKMDLAWRENLEKENEQLKKENFQLHITNQKLREVVVENTRLKKMLALKEESQYDYIIARVIATGTEKGVNTLILNAGTQDSVKINMAVVNADGLIGKIIAVSSGESVVQLLKDHDCWVGARLQNSREIGIVGWDGSAWLNLQYIPKNIPVKQGELVITSGLSEIYPPGLKIGIVADSKDSEGDLFKKIQVTPAVKFNSIEEVFIIKTEISENTASE
jgi:rod shape-determining protein MreC